MADYNKILQKFFGAVACNYIVTDADWVILRTFGEITIDDDVWARWTRMYHDDPIEGMNMKWEIADKRSGQYYKVSTAAVEDDGEMFLVHELYDVSDYAIIFHDLSSYSRMWRAMSMCQSDLINVLTDKLTGGVKRFFLCFYIIYLNQLGFHLSCHASFFHATTTRSMPA